MSNTKAEVVTEDTTPVVKTEKKQDTKKVNKFLGLTQSEIQKKSKEIISKYTILDKEGRQMFVDSKKVFDELCLPEDEAKQFLGVTDLNEYFREGKVHVRWIKTLGDRLPEDRLEVTTLRQLAPSMSDILVFKNPIENLYTYLIPKRLSSLEKNENGDYASDIFDCDTVVINFNGGVYTKEFGKFPSSFEPTFFKRYFKRTLNILKSKEENTF